MADNADLARRMHEAWNERNFDELADGTAPDAILTVVGSGDTYEGVQGAREYAEMWVDALVRLRPELPAVDARAHVHAVFGLLNSSPRLPSMAEAELRRVLTAMASAALRS